MNVAVYRDGENPVRVIESLNNMCGSIVVDPRPDLKGSYIVDDILSVQIQPYMSGWVGVAMFSLWRDSDSAISFDGSITVGLITEQQDLVGKRLSPHGENYPIGI